MKILYLGDTNERSTSWHRACALRRLGHEVETLNPDDFVPGLHSIPFFPSFNVRTGYRLVAPVVGARLRSRLSQRKWDLVWIDCGPQLSPAFYRWLRKSGAPVVNYMTDNPFQKRDYRKWDLYRKCLPLQDLTVVPRVENIAEALRAGAKDVMRVSFSYDPIVHAPTPGGAPAKKHDVVFVGSWMPERGPFALEALRRGLSLRIVGDGWPRSPEWPALKSHWLGGSVYGREYVGAIESARIAIGLLSKGNRDLHTTRSVEIPFIGSAAFCAERTSEHMEMYREGVEAVFWNSPGECVDACLKLLADPPGCALMASRARNRVIELGLSNDVVTASILSRMGLSR